MASTPVALRKCRVWPNGGSIYIDVYNIRIREQQCHRRPNSNDALLTPKKSCRCPCTRNGDRILKVLTRVYADAYRMKAFIQQAP